MDPAESSVESGAGLSRRIRDTFVAPARLAAEIRATAPWLDVLLISMVIALVSVALMPDEVFTGSMGEAVSRRGEPVQITSPPEEIARWGRVMGLLGTIATHPIIALSIAGLLTLTFSVVGGGRTNFREYLALASHAMLIPALGTLLALVVRLATGLGLDALYRPDEAGNLLVAAATSLDPFIIWMLVVLGFGAHALEPRHSRVRASTILVGGYLLLILGSVALLHPEL